MNYFSRQTGLDLGEGVLSGKREIKWAVIGRRGNIYEFPVLKNCHEIPPLRSPKWVYTPLRICKLIIKRFNQSTLRV